MIILILLIFSLLILFFNISYKAGYLLASIIMAMLTILVPFALYHFWGEINIVQFISLILTQIVSIGGCVLYFFKYKDEY